MMAKSKVGLTLIPSAPVTCINTNTQVFSGDT
jgi:hypothetical protein